MAVAVTGGTDRFLRFAVRRFRVASVARPRQRNVQLALNHGMDEFANPIAQPTFDRIKAVVEKITSPLGCRREESGFVVTLVMAWSPSDGTGTQAVRAL